MKRDGDQDAVDIQAARKRFRQGTLHMAEFVVDGDAQRLKGARRRVYLAGIADGLGHDLGQLSGGP